MSLFFARFPYRRVGRWLLIIAAIYGVGWLLWSAWSALTPFIVGIVLAYLLLPLVNRLNRSMPRWTAILIVYVITLAIIAGFFAYIVPPLAEQIGRLLRSLPNLAEIQAWSDLAVSEYQQILSTLPPDLRSEIQSGVSGLVNQGLNTLRSNFVTYLQGLGSFLVNSALSVVNTVTFLLGFFLIPFWLFYVLMDQRSGAETVNRVIWERLRPDFWALVTIIDRVLSGYVRGQLVLGVSVGTAAGLGLSVLSMFGLQVDYILLLAVIAGITELIPVIGPIVGAIPAIILGFIDSPTTGLAVTVLYILIQQLENNFLVPRIVGESVGIHAAVLMVLLVVASQVFGLVGAILCAPMAAVARDIFSYLYGRLSEPPRPAGELPERIRDVRPTPEPPPPPRRTPKLAPTPEPQPHPPESVPAEAAPVENDPKPA